MEELMVHEHETLLEVGKLKAYVNMYHNIKIIEYGN